MTVWARADVREAFGELLARSGEAATGWKIGVASPRAMANAGIDAPLVGVLCESGRTESGATLDVSAWVDPRLEPEIAVFLGADVPVGTSEAQASAAIASIALAFELVDIDGPLTDAPAMLRGNVFQRGVVLGERVAAATPPAVTVLVDGEVRAEIVDPLAVVGAFGPLVQHVAEVLGGAGRILRAGEVIITGVLTPPLPLTPGRYAMRGEGLGEIEVSIRAARESTSG
jgi:2-oxo-3-hexenedioate decarboxylase